MPEETMEVYSTLVLSFGYMTIRNSTTAYDYAKLHDYTNSQYHGMTIRHITAEHMFYITTKKYSRFPSPGVFLNYTLSSPAKRFPAIRSHPVEPIAFCGLSMKNPNNPDTTKDACLARFKRSSASLPDSDHK